LSSSGCTEPSSLPSYSFLSLGSGRGEDALSEVARENTLLKESLSLGGGDILVLSTDRSDIISISIGKFSITLVPFLNRI
jgi:hypothetical protein